ncbi:MAG TPA: DEAD/DEAH box helicase, partial [Actinocrinis sp.]|nr:DEAD/DEAH box helicase [Actinocrinis sp.]
QVTALLDQVAPDGQRMLFSATLDRNVDQLVRRFLTDPVTHSVDPATATVSTMEHHLLHVQGFDKNATIANLDGPDLPLIAARCPGKKSRIKAIEVRESG